MTLGQTIVVLIVMMMGKLQVIYMYRVTSCNYTGDSGSDYSGSNSDDDGEAAGYIHV